MIPPRIEYWIVVTTEAQPVIHVEHLMRLGLEGWILCGIERPNMVATYYFYRYQRMPAPFTGWKDKDKDIKA